MDRLAYIAMTGAKNTLLAQSTNANNLANVDTVGFKADLDYFQSKPVYGPGAPTRAYAEDNRAGYESRSGTLQQTGNPLDIAINGEGWFAVQAKDGGTAYTRRGDLRTDPNGLLMNGAGQPLMGDGGPITLPPYEAVIVGKDGTVSVRPQGGAENELLQVDRLVLVNPEATEMEKGEDGLFRVKGGGDAEPDAYVHVSAGAIESSNVNAVEAMVNLIEYARNFEVQTKFFKVAEELDDRSARLMSLT